jgi:adenine-specific DNA-methyltransferase
VYPDDYAEPLRTYLEYTGQVDADGKRFGTNAETDGRFHSKWLNMMYPRLYLARNLLRDDGALFVTIDDHEVDNLRKLGYEIFGEENFVAQIEWQKRYTRSNNTDDFTSVIDHVVVFAKSSQFKPRLAERDEVADGRYQNPDNDSRGPWKAVPFLNPLSPDERPNLVYPIAHPSGRMIAPKKKAWRSEQSVWLQLVAENRVWWGKDGNAETPNVKRFLSEVRQGMTPINFWDHEFAGHTDAANQELNDVFGNKVFDTPKPIRLIQRMIQLATDRDDDVIVLDFFAGSGTTGHAVLALNQKDGGSRRFILVQLPEPTGRADYPTIADIAKERIRRVAGKLGGNRKGAPAADGIPTQDHGFRVFKLADSNILPWDSGATEDVEVLESRLDGQVDPIRPGRTDEDIVFEVILNSGFPLTVQVEVVCCCGKTIYRAAGGRLLICLERRLTPQLILAIADMMPDRVVLLDAGFAGDDALRANAAQTFKSRGVISFKTV